MGLHPTFSGNPGQKWQWTARIDGFDVAYFEQATFPAKELEEDVFNPAGSVRGTKFAGRATIGDIVIKKGKKADGPDLAGYAWLTSACNTASGDLGDPAEYKKDIDLIRTNRMGVAVETYTCKGAWVKKVEIDDGDGGSSEHQIETLTIAIDDFDIV